MHMKEQNYQNHSRYVTGYHFVTSAAWLALLIGSIVNLVHSARENLYSASLIVLATLILGSLFWYARSFALRAQDKAIRAEENFRHFILTGKPLPAGLRMGQIIALRFASDAEYPELTQKALDEKLKGSEIKKAIRQWRPDYHRA